MAFGLGLSEDQSRMGLEQAFGLLASRYRVRPFLRYPGFTRLSALCLHRRPSDHWSARQDAASSIISAFLRKGELGSDFSIIDCLDRLTTEAADFIVERSKALKPFFLYFPLTAPHKPTLPHSRYQGRSGLGPYGDFVIQVDEVVGSILDTIDEQGITDNTVVFYTSDNGSYMYRYQDPNAVDHVKDASVQGYYEENHIANGPLRGTKADIWEAGHRVPFFVRWPERIQWARRATRPLPTRIFSRRLCPLREEDPSPKWRPRTASIFPPCCLAMRRIGSEPRSSIIRAERCSRFERGIGN